MKGLNSRASAFEISSFNPNMTDLLGNTTQTDCDALNRQIVSEGQSNQFAQTPSSLLLIAIEI
jgi:hypothetical protein